MAVTNNNIMAKIKEGGMSNTKKGVHEPKAEEIVETAEILEKVVAKEETKAAVETKEAEVAPVPQDSDIKEEGGKKLKLTYKWNPVTRSSSPVWEEVEEPKK